MEMTKREALKLFEREIKDLNDDLNGNEILTFEYLRECVYELKRYVDFMTK